MTVHGHCKNSKRSRTYRTWLAMRRRCNDVHHPRYEYYGGRGIRVCWEWDNSFPKFLRDMGRRPSRCTIDRINVDGDYCKENCKWSTPIQQAGNRQINREQNILADDSRNSDYVKTGKQFFCGFRH